MTVVQYDARRRRLWIAGQRCHHGATGALITGVAVTAMLATRQHVTGLGAVVAVGSGLMLHDWDDRSLWFRAGPQAA